MLGLGGLAQACNGIKLLFTLHTAAGLWISELALNELPEEPGPGCEEGKRSLRWVTASSSRLLLRSLQRSAPRCGWARDPHSPQRAGLSSVWICLGENSLNRAGLESDSGSVQKPNGRFPAQCLIHMLFLSWTPYSSIVEDIFRWNALHHPNKHSLTRVWWGCGQGETRKGNSGWWRKWKNKATPGGFEGTNMTPEPGSAGQGARCGGSLRGHSSCADLPDMLVLWLSGTC